MGSNVFKEVSEKYVDLKRKIIILTTLNLLFFLLSFLYVFVFNRENLLNEYVLPLYIIVSLHILSIYYQLVNIVGIAIFFIYEISCCFLYCLKDSGNYQLDFLSTLLTILLVVSVNTSSLYVVRKISEICGKLNV